MSTIRLNVGGQIFETTKETLLFSDYFKAFLTNWTHDKEIFIDRSPKLFEHVLCLLRDPSYPYPKKYKGELDFYQIKYDLVETDEEKNIRENKDLEGKRFQELMKIIKECDKFNETRYQNLGNILLEKIKAIENTNITKLQKIMINLDYVMILSKQLANKCKIRYCNDNAVSYRSCSKHNDMFDYDNPKCAKEITNEERRLYERMIGKK